MSIKHCGGKDWHEFDGYCYKVIRQPMNWQQGQLACKKENANLTSIHSVLENDFIASLGIGMTLKNGAESGF